MFTKGRIIACVIGIIYFSVFYVVAAFAHTRGHHQHDEVQTTACQSVVSTAKKATQKNDQVAAKFARYESNENKPEYLEALGWIYVDIARTQSDERLIDYAGDAALCMLEKDPSSLSGKLLLGYVRHQQHRFSEARALARELVAARGYWFDHALLGDVVAEQGDLHTAVTAYEAMVSQRPGAQSFARIAHLRWLTGDVHGAISAARLAVGAASGSKEHSAWIQTKLGELLFFSGDLAAAMQLGEHAAKTIPDYAPALVLRGRVFMAQQQPNLAIPVLEQALSRSPLPETQWLLLEAISDAGDLRTTQGLRSALINNHEDPRTIATFLATRKIDLNKALVLAQAELDNRQDALTLDALAWAYYSNGNMADAARLSNRAVNHGLQHGRIYLHAALIQDRLGNHDVAEEYLLRAHAQRHVLMPSERKLLDTARTQTTS
ncbi:MAG: tetratricopeptide repeat protein [Pseudomonadota bacterium]